MLITRRWFFFAFAATLLGSATPPSEAFEPVRHAARPVPRLAYAPEAFRTEDEVIASPAPPATAAQPAREAEPRWAELQTIEQAVENDGGPVRIVVSIPQQKAYVFTGDDLFGTSPVSTGKKGHSTPTGIFRILEKKVHHRSNLYSNAPMPYMQRLTMGGVALHAGHLPGYPASHGCIRLPWSFARKLYGITDYGTKVTVTNQRFDSADEALDAA
jgi:lipoprotein-anchoring transpeptidase ErfK/SrfK